MILRRIFRADKDRRAARRSYRWARYMVASVRSLKQRTPRKVN